MRICNAFELLFILKVLTFKWFRNITPMDAISSWNFDLMWHVWKLWDLLLLLVLKFFCFYHNLRVTGAHWQDNDSVQTAWFLFIVLRALLTIL